MKQNLNLIENHSRRRWSRPRRPGAFEDWQAGLDRAGHLQELRGLDDRRLRDIGVTGDEVAAVLAAPLPSRPSLALAALVRWLGKADRVVLTTAVLFFGLALLLPEQFVASLLFTLDSPWFVAPFLLLSALLAAGLSTGGWTFWRDPQRLGAVRWQTLAIGGFLLKWLTLAFLIESLMVVSIPGGSAAWLLGGEQWWVVPALVLVASRPA